MMKFPALLALGALPACALTLTPVGELPIPPDAATGMPPMGLSGITYAEGDRWYAMKDTAGLLYPLTIGLDRASGAVTNCTLGTPVTLRPVPSLYKRDFEDVAWDAAVRCVWASDECDASIRAFSPDTGTELAAVAIPPVFDAFRFNRSFEALSLRANGFELWTCNEEALCSRETSDRQPKDVAPMTVAPEVDDGPRATAKNGSVVRLQKFTRPAFNQPWVPSGQWAYETDTIGGRSFIGKSRCGVAGLCVLDDGTVLALERELSVKSAMMPSFRCRIYQIDFTGATDTSAIMSLKGADVKKVAKRRVFSANTGFAMYEGIALGPVLADGSRSVLLISDGDDGAVTRLYALKLTP